MTPFKGHQECGREMPFILSVKDAPGNELRVIAALPVTGEKGTHLGDIENSVLKEILKESHPVFPNREHPYEIIFPATSCVKCGMNPIPHRMTMS